MLKIKIHFSFDEIKNNYFKKNEIGSAVKDFSNAYFWNNIFIQNMTDIQVYQKKKIFGGGRIFLKSEDSKSILTSVEKSSKILFFPNATYNKAKWISNYPKSITKFFAKLEAIEFDE